MILQLNHTAAISRFFEILVDKCEDRAMLFLTTRPQGHLRFQDGGWANWASWGRLHGGRVILAPGLSFFSDRIILAVGWSWHWGQIQPFICKLKAENIPRSDDPSPKMILALGSSSFHVNGP